MPKKRARDSSQEQIDRYQRKIRKLEEKQRHKRRRILVETSSDSDDTPTHQVDEPVPTSSAQKSDEDREIAIAAPIEIPELTTQVPISETPTCPEPDPELDPELLLALGEETGHTSQFGDKIHQSLAQRWEPILKKGLTKEAKDKLHKDYLVPENCTLLQAPKLNSEVAAAVSEAARHRDKRKETEQQLLGIGISAVNKALTLMLTSDEKLESIRIISDGCRILTDLHYQQTQARISVINYSLAKPFLNVVQDSERDDTLFGNKLAEKIKASKSIEKQGLSIKKFTRNVKNTDRTEQGPSSGRPQYPGPSTSYQGNWTGPPRFQQSRGGRRGARRASAPVNRRLPPPASSAAGPNRFRSSVTRQ